MTDVIIVGAGSAGGVLADRLSADGRSVLLLEAGPDYPPTAADQPPAIRDATDLSPTDHDWGYESQPSHDAERLPLHAGRIVGGSSATNNAMALRGHPADYDAWAAAGNPGWSFEELVPSFERVERDIAVGRRRRNELTPIHDAFLSACERAGDAPVGDHNAPGAIGAGTLPLNAVDGVRQSVALTCLARARRRPNLTLRADTRVARVILERGRTVGVSLATGERLHADQIVLSAGAYGTPALLLRSGIGDAEDLASLDISVRHDLRGVGRNLQDHPLARLELSATGDGVADIPLQTLLTRRSEGAVTPAPDVQIFPSGPSDSGTMLLLVGIVKPDSRGILRLRTPDVETPPSIDPGHLRTAHDTARMRDALALARELATTPPLADHLHGDPPPELGSYQHPVGTCRMGPVDDPDAVVDHAGRVHGIDGLFAIDASVMPSIPSANTNLPTMMLADRMHELAWSR